MQVGLSRDRRRDRGVGRWKGRSDTVPSGREHIPARGLDRGAQELVVSRKGDLHARRVLGPQARRALHVGEQEAHLARGLLDHRASLARGLAGFPGFGFPDEPLIEIRAERPPSDGSAVGSAFRCLCVITSRPAGLSRAEVFASVVRRSGPHVIEASIIPTALFYSCLVVAGLGAAYAVALIWLYASILTASPGNGPSRRSSCSARSA